MYIHNRQHCNYLVAFIFIFSVQFSHAYRLHSTAFRLFSHNRDQSTLFATALSNEHSPASRAAKPNKLPVTLLSGFLGSGKTTLLNHILTSSALTQKYAVIVNDMAEVNIDSALISPHIKRREEKLVEMHNGCICCTLREDLLHEISRLAEENQYDHLIIESTGISEPLPVAETFLFEEEMPDGSMQSLSNVAEIDTMVTMVDAKHFLRDMQEAEELKERNLQASEDDTRSITDLLVSQVEFATVVVVNKCDLVDQQTLMEVKQTIRALNADAKIIEASFGRIDLKEIIGSKSYNFDKVLESPTWQKAISEQSHNHHHHDDGHIRSEAEEYGIESFVFRARRPFHPERLHEFIATDLDQTSGVAAANGRVLRSKGFFWLASRFDECLIWAQAGGLFHITSGGRWLAADHQIDEDIDNAELKQVLEEIGDDWQEPWGDRRQEVVIIGVHINKENLTQRLEKSLLTEDEWAQWLLNGRVEDVFNDPFPILVLEEEEKVHDDVVVMGNEKVEKLVFIE